MNLNIFIQQMLYDLYSKVIKGKFFDASGQCVMEITDLEEVLKDEGVNIVKTEPFNVGKYHSYCIDGFNTCSGKVEEINKHDISNFLEVFPEYDKEFEIIGTLQLSEQNKRQLFFVLGCEVGRKVNKNKKA